MAAPALVALLALSAAAPDVTVEPQADGRLRLTIVFANTNPEMYARAMLRLQAEAARQCRGRGRPVSVGAMEVNPVRERRGRLALTETYRCGPPPA